MDSKFFEIKQIKILILMLDSLEEKHVLYYLQFLLIDIRRMPFIKYTKNYET